ncbi:hypothetical protein K450DRAFT_245485 [Umbelopsis ramanniana AG]|uniref:Uncharacterized protein n=1 Tax=Umbelopsis ramanniana AG TaxID=1314678 RepID=A0AAD5E7H0_UMBRA|nr:uncharacterized protein K450DRAFT_245485 [Umbelopsis ramanniana AG]KAI8578781.1 hypothetical protein K450DRAFT_245485 [Umbelopsis ramanniana AG]
MSASMMGLGITEGSGGGRNYGSPSYTGVSPTSSSSSQSRYHQPAVPSPLHAEQRVGPIHIPRDMSAPTIASHLHRRQLSHENQTNVRSSPPQTTTSTHVLSSPDRAAYSSYPTDPHHKDLKRLPPRSARSPPDNAQLPSPRSRDILSPRSPPSTIDRPSKSVTLERLATSASPPRNIPRHISNRHASSGGSSPIIGPRPDLQPTSYSSLNEDANESSQRNRPENSGHALASGTRSGSLLDDDDSLVFKMSELGNETGTFDSGVYNNPYQGSLYSGGKDSPRQRLLVGPNSHFASTSGSPKIGTSGGEAMSRRPSSGSGAAMATVMEQEEPNTASSNSSSSSAHERRAGGPDAHMFSGDW